MGSELAKTLRSMSDDHRMVPDFSEELLDIADTIERLQKEMGLARKQRSEFAQSGLRLEAERDAALAASAAYKKEIARLKNENDRLRRPRCFGLGPEEIGDPCKFCGAREATDVCRDGTDHIIRERDAAVGEVERLKRIYKHGAERSVLGEL